MGKSKKINKRKRNSGGSDDRPAKINNGGHDVSVSDSLHSANNVLFEDVIVHDNVFINESESTSTNRNSYNTIANMDASVGLVDSQTGESADHSTTTTSTSTSCTDILNYLKQMDKRIMAIDNRLSTLDTLEKQVTNFESDLKKLWTLVYDNNTVIHEKTNKLTDEVEGLNYSLSQAQDEISKLKRDKVNIEDNLLYVQSQSMRNNLMFANIPESTHEKPEDCERLVRQLLTHKLQLAQEIVDSISFERVHRTGEKATGENVKPRNIVAKFSSFKDRELVRRDKVKLKGTNIFIFEQFPKEIADRRRSLLPKLKQAFKDGKRAWLSYDTLYVDGRPVRSGNQ